MFPLSSRIYISQDGPDVSLGLCPQDLAKMNPKLCTLWGPSNAQGLWADTQDGAVKSDSYQPEVLSSILLY